jgi:sortase A
MPPIPARRKRPILRWMRWAFVLFGVASLGFVGYSLLDARLFEAYENWRLDHAANFSRPLPSIARKPAASGSALTVEQPRLTTVAMGSAIGRIEISRIGIAAIIVEGTSARSLRRAVGHIPGTALPGEQGNVAIAGHRDTFFRALRSVREGDEILLTTPDGSYRYVVDSTTIFAPDDAEALADSNEAILTLVTCYPFYFVGPAPQRFIVRAHRSER